MIDAEGLTKYYGLIPAVAGVSFHIGAGEIAGLLGPNGAGKTTILKMLTGFMRPSSGRILVDGRDSRREPLAIRRKIGFLPESVPLYTDLSVGRFLRFAAQVKGVSRGRVTAEIDRVAGLCGLKGYERRLIKHLSKGLRQRVGLAQALVNDPPILILDEPTTGLDPSQIVEIRGLIRGLGGNRTVLLSTHILPEASQLCERVIIINKGRIVAEDSPVGLSSQLQGRKGQRTVLRVDAPFEELRQKLTAVKAVRDVSAMPEAGVFEVISEAGERVGPELARSIVGSGWALHEMRARDFSLEEIFMQLVTDEGGGTRS